MKKVLVVVSLLGVGVICGLALKLGNIVPSLSPRAERPNVDSKPTSSPDALFRGEIKAQQVLAEKVLKDIRRGIRPSDFQTGSDRFDGEWVIGSYQMAALGLGQIITAHPQLRKQYLPALEQCVERLLSPELNRFGADAWGEQGLAALDSGNGHAYLGYTNLALSMLRLHQPNNRFAQVNDELTAALVRRLAASPYGIIETYPREAYPPDLAAVISSIGLYDRATGSNHQALLTSLKNQFRRRFIDSKTGLVFQAVNASSGKPVDRPRASGTALSAYFFSFFDPTMAKTIFQSLANKQKVSVMGLSGIREYPVGEEGKEDIDSGPLMWGLSPSATAFSVGGARIIGDQALYQDLYRTIKLAGGSPLGEMNGVSLLESPLGNAILLAMLTAGKAPG
jgi:hypothetical protein